MVSNIQISYKRHYVKHKLNGVNNSNFEPTKKLLKYH